MQVHSRDSATPWPRPFVTVPGLLTGHQVLAAPSPPPPNPIQSSSVPAALCMAHTGAISSQVFPARLPDSSRDSSTCPKSSPSSPFPFNIRSLRCCRFSSRSLPQRHSEINNLRHLYLCSIYCHSTVDCLSAEILRVGRSHSPGESQLGLSLDKRVDTTTSTILTATFFSTSNYLTPSFRPAGQELDVFFTVFFFYFFGLACLRPFRLLIFRLPSF